MSDSLIALIAIGVFVIVIFVGIKYFNAYMPVRVAFIIIFFASLIAAIVLGLKAWGPKGFSSMFNNDDNTLQEGEADIDSVSTDYAKTDLERANVEIYADLKAQSDQYSNKSVFVIVKKDIISFEEVEFEDIESFEEFFRTVNFADKELYVIDAYAVSSTMHSVIEVIEKYHPDYYMEQR